MSTAFATEEYEQFNILFSILHQAGVPVLSNGSGKYEHLFFGIDAAMDALDVPDEDRVPLLQHMREDQVVHEIPSPGGTGTMLVCPWVGVTDAIAKLGDHQACWDFWNWRIDVWQALEKHGCYDPARQHEPLPGQELEAAQIRDTIKDGWRRFFGPLFGGAVPD